MHRLPLPNNSRVKAGVIAEMNRRAMSIFFLWKACAERGHKISRTSIAEWLDGKRDLRTSNLDAIMDTLDLEIRPREPK